MNKATAKRLASAQERLRRIEAMIRPYRDNQPLPPKREKQEWMPGDQMIIRETVNLEPREEAQDSN